MDTATLLEDLSTEIASDLKGCTVAADYGLDLQLCDLMARQIAAFELQRKVLKRMDQLDPDQDLAVDLDEAQRIAVYQLWSEIYGWAKRTGRDELRRPDQVSRLINKIFLEVSVEIDEFSIRRYVHAIPLNDRQAGA